MLVDWFSALQRAEIESLLAPLPRQLCKLAAFAIPGVLEVDPVMRIDPCQRDAVTRAQDLDQDAPRRHLRLGGTARHIREIAGEFHADRIVADHLTKGRAVV